MSPPVLHTAGMTNSPRRRPALDVFRWRGWRLILPSLLATAINLPSARATGTTHSTRVRPKLISKGIFIYHENGRPPASGFVSYLHATKPVLMHCAGREDYSDGYDDYAISVSRDNGKTWSKNQGGARQRRKTRE